MAVMIQDSKCKYDAQKGTSYGLMQISIRTFDDVCSGVGDFNDIKLGKMNTDKNIE